MITNEKKIVITGGAGFIGSQIGYELHRQGWQVTIIDNLYSGNIDNLIFNGSTFGDFIAKDIRDPNLEEYFEGANYIIHLAGIAPLPICESEPQFAYDVNTSGTANVLKAAKNVGVNKVIFSSTSAVYECNTEEILKETDPVSPNLIYACTKLSAENICKSFATNYGMNIIIARFFNVYGPHQDFKRKSPPFTSYLAKEVISGRTPVLFNDSSAKRDYVHSSDVIQLLTKMLNNKKHYSAEIYNVGSGNGYSVPDICKLFSEIAETKINVEYKNPESYWNAYDNLFSNSYPLSRKRVRKEVYKNAIADTSKTEAEFNWQAKYTMRKGLESVYKYQKKFDL